MANIASALKAEIARVARKESRAEVQALKKASARHRSSIASLKREITALERQLRAVGGRAKKASQSVGSIESGVKRRFSAERLAAHRAKLGLSAHDYGRLVGVSGLSIYKWEGGNVRPRDSQLEAIARVRLMGKREASARLAELD